jgi:hypothetical protein
MQVCFIYSNTKVNAFKNIQKKKFNENIELVAKHISTDNKLKKQVVFVLGSIFYVQDIVHAADGLDKIDIGGRKILAIVQKIGYWVCLVGCIIDIVKSLMQGDTRSIAKIMMKYGLAFASLYRRQEHS